MPEGVKLGFPKPVIFYYGSQNALGAKTWKEVQFGGMQCIICLIEITHLPPKNIFWSDQTDQD